MILVIDDHELNVKFLRILLEHAGYRVTSAGDAREARARVEAERPCLILMDIQLPETDGIQLTREFKATPRLWEVPIIAVTSRAMKGDEERIRAAGCDAYMSKPIDGSALLRMIDGFLHAWFAPRGA